MQVKKHQSEPDKEQWSGSKLQKEYVKAVYCFPAYLTLMQSTLCEMLGWIESQAATKIAGRNINNLRYVDYITLMAEKKEKLRSLLMRVKEESEKAGLKLNIQSGSPFFVYFAFLCLQVSQFSSVQFSPVAQSCPTLCDPMNCSTPDLPVHHQLPEFTQTNVHRVSDAFQPSHPQSSPSPPAPNLSQHQSLFQ